MEPSSEAEDEECCLRWSCFQSCGWMQRWMGGLFRMCIVVLGTRRMVLL
jgi:hypothetical protein